MPEKKNPFESFHDYYGPRPVEFVKDCLGAEPDEKQVEALNAYGAGERRIALRSGHGVGKTTLLAWIIIHALLTKFPFKGVATSPTEDQLYDGLAAEVKAWIDRLPLELKAQLDVRGEFIALLAAPDASFFSFRTARAEKPEALQGIHSENVLLVIDEASGVPEQIFVAGLGSMSTEGAQTIMAGNPTRDSGFFHDAFHKNVGWWKAIHISCVGHPRVSPDFIKQIRDTYGEESNEYRVRVLGEFPRAGDDTLIPRDIIESAAGREIAPPPPSTPIIWGLDCARFGDDLSALCKRQSFMVLEPIKTWAKLDTMELAAVIHNEYKATPVELRPAEILVDVINMGAGVVDRLYMLGLPVRGINVSEGSTDKRYLNMRAELWWKARDWFYTKGVVLPEEDTELVEELVRVRKKFSTTGRLQAESKADMKRRGEKSPDRADAFILTFASDHTTLVTGTSQGNISWNQPFLRRLKSVV